MSMLRQYNHAVRIIIIQRHIFLGETAMFPPLHQLPLAQPKLDPRQKHISCSGNATPGIRFLYLRACEIHVPSFMEPQLHSTR